MKCFWVCVAVACCTCALCVINYFKTYIPIPIRLYFAYQALHYRHFPGKYSNELLYFIHAHSLSILWSERITFQTSSYPEMLRCGANCCEHASLFTTILTSSSKVQQLSTLHIIRICIYCFHLRL